MLGATGGVIMMFFSVLMMILSVLIPFFIWRIWKWSYTTSQELSQLNEKFDQLLRLQQGGTTTLAAPSPVAELAAPAITAAWDDEPAEEPAADEPLPTEATESDDVDPLASAFDVADLQPETAEEETFEQATPADSTEAPESGFEFAVSPEDAFGEDQEEESLDDASGFEFGETDELAEQDADEEDDPFAGAAIGDKDEGDDFSFDAEEDSEVASLNQEFDNAFGQADEPADDSDDSEFDRADSFGGETAEEFAGDTPAQEDGPPADPDEDLFAAETIEPEAATETQPDIIALEADPKRPSVSLARCGKCDHKLAYKDSLSGKKARCPSCQSAFVLP